MAAPIGWYEVSKQLTKKEDRTKALKVVTICSTLLLFQPKAWTLKICSWFVWWWGCMLDHLWPDATEEYNTKLKAYKDH